MDNETYFILSCKFILVTHLACRVFCEVDGVCQLHFYGWSSCNPFFGGGLSQTASSWAVISALCAGPLSILSSAEALWDCCPEFLRMC